MDVEDTHDGAMFSFIIVHVNAMKIIWRELFEEQYPWNGLCSIWSRYDTAMANILVSRRVLIRTVDFVVSILPGGFPSFLPINVAFELECVYYYHL